jgi:hypothetical protein
MNATVATSTTAAQSLFLNFRKGRGSYHREVTIPDPWKGMAGPTLVSTSLIRFPLRSGFLAACFIVLLETLLIPSRALGAEQWDVYETTFTSAKEYDNPFMDVQVDAVFRNGDRKWIVPAFWAGRDKWTVRFAPPVRGDYTFQVRCSDVANKELNGDERPLRVTAYNGDNPLLKHGFLRVSADKRHFEHADGTPFLWLADTWWKNLCKRMTWEGFQELTADRKAKGFNVVQIVCGPYPDENFFAPSWENEGGQPYLIRPQIMYHTLLESSLRSVSCIAEVEA